MKVGSHLGIDQHGSAFIHRVEHFYHMLSLALRISGHAGSILKIQLPAAHGRRPLHWFVQLGQPRGDTSGSLEDPIDRAAGARQPLALQLLIARQVVEQRFGPWRPPQALRRLVAHLDDAVSHRLTDALRRRLARPRATVQHLLVARLCLLQALLPFLDPAQRHAHRLGILGLRPLRVLLHQTTQVGPRCVVYCFHDGTSWLIVLYPASSVPLLLLSLQGYDVPTPFRSRGWQLIHSPLRMLMSKSGQERVERVQLIDPTWWIESTTRSSCKH